MSSNSDDAITAAASNRMHQSQTLLTKGNSFYAKRAAQLAKLLSPTQATKQNYEIICATIQSWSTPNVIAPVPQPIPWAEQFDLLYSLERERFRRATIPHAYRGRVKLACVLLVVAIIARWLFGGPIPLHLLLTGYVYRSSNGNFTFAFSHGFGWFLLSLLWNYMIRPPPRRRRDNLQHSSPQSNQNHQQTNVSSSTQQNE